VSKVPVSIIVFPKGNASHPVYDITVITSTEGTYSDNSLRISEPDYSAMGTFSLFSKLKNEDVPSGRLYEINATAVVNGSSTSGSTSIEIRNSFLTSTNIALYMGALWFILFIIAVWWPMKSSEKKPEEKPEKKSRLEYFKAGMQSKEIAVFFLISATVLTPIVAFLLVDIQVGKGSPLGLVKKEILVNGTANIQWVINVGGWADNGFSSGIQVPIYILVFGIAGGYIRYLFEIYNGWRRQLSAPVITDPTNGSDIKDKNPEISGTSDPSVTVIVFDGNNPVGTTKADKKGVWSVRTTTLSDGTHAIKAKATDDTESSSAFSDTVLINIAQAVVGPISPKKSVTEKDDKNLELFKKSLQEMALIFLAPLLAIAIWFVLFQGGTTADYTLAAIGITTGFLIREIVTRLIAFASPAVTGQQVIKP
ncbi:MAG TPA: Ig-like domain-containing protein, partial [Nitrososphaeraceae archaeon]